MRRVETTVKAYAEYMNQTKRAKAVDTGADQQAIGNVERDPSIASLYRLKVMKLVEAIGGLEMLPERAGDIRSPGRKRDEVYRVHRGDVRGVLASISLRSRWFPGVVSRWARKASRNHHSSIFQQIF